MTELGKNISLSGQCFPVRSLTRHNVFEETTGGAWLVAYKAEQRRRFKAVLCREPDVALPIKSSVSKQSFKLCKEDEETRRKLDGFYLMKVCCVNDPLDLCSINISGRGLNQVNEEDFSLFKNVIHIDAGENNLQLMHFRTFSCLKELELPLNNLSGTINIDEKDFSWLETLDLSCNNLTNNDILALGILPALKVLHLTGNRLKELPPEMSRSYLLNKGHRNSRFSCLEKLWLDQNDLADTNTFTSLAGLKRLKYLNLEHNSISSVPHLKLLKPKTNLRLSSNEYFPNNNTPEADKDPKLRLERTPIVDKVLDSELADVNSKISSLEDIMYNDKNEEEKAINNAVKDEANNFIYEHLKDLQVLPFPSLQHLNLANNHIEEEDGLLALSTWSSLEELVIWGNPVASCGKEGPPIVAYHLGIVSGIQVTRHKPSKKDERKNLTSQTFIKHPRRVQDLPPVGPNRRLLMLDAPKYPEISCGRPNEVRPLPPITAPSKETRNISPERVSSALAKEQSEKSRHVSRPLGEDSRDSVRSKLRSVEFRGPVKTNGEPSTMQPPRATTPRHGEAPSPEDRVFLTQVDDVDNEELLFFNDDEPKKTVEEKPLDNGAKPTVVDKKYKGYEDLLNIDEEYPEDIKLPTNIHGNVRALQYVLDHPLIFTEHSTKHRTRRKTKPSEQRTITQKSSRTTAVEELGIILDKMRTHSKTVESNLDDVLKDSENQRIKKEFKEAKKLLNEVQTKYNEVRCQSLSSTAMAADIMQRELSNSLPGSRDGKKQKTCSESDKIKSANDLKKFKERLDSRI